MNCAFRYEKSPNIGTNRYIGMKVVDNKYNERGK